MTDLSEISFVLTKILLALTALAGIVVLVLTTMKARHVRGSLALIIASLGTLLWSSTLFASLWFSGQTIDVSIYVFALSTSFCFAWLAYAYQSSLNTRNVVLLAIPIFLFLAFAFVPGFMFNGYSSSLNGSIETSGAMGYFIFHILFYAYLILASIKLISRRAITRNATLRQQFEFLLFGTLVFALIKFIANIILGGFYGIITLNPLMPSAALIPLFIAYGVVTQYYFIDLKYILYSFIGKIALFLFSGLTYLLALLSIGALARGHNILTYHIAFLITLLASLKLAPILKKEAVLLAAGPRERAYKDAVDRFILDLYEQQHTPVEISNATIQLCGEILSASNSQLIIEANGNERELLLLTSIRMSGASFLEESTILLLETTSTSEIGVPSPQEKFGEELRNIYGAALVATLSSQGTLYGLLILGERKDGRGYSKQDVALVQSILLPLSSALAEASFRTRITLLTRSSDNETGKLREKVFQKNTKNIMLIEALENSSREALRQIRSKVDAINQFGPSAVHAALETVEKSTLEIERSVARLHTEVLKPITEQADLAPLLHKLIEVYGARSLIEQSHLSYELPESIPVIGDPQQIYEAIALLFQAVFTKDCCKEEYISFKVSLMPNTIEITLMQKYSSDKEIVAETEWTNRQKCLMAYDNPLAESLIKRNNGVLRGEMTGNTTAETHITLIRDIGEDRGGMTE